MSGPISGSILPLKVNLLGYSLQQTGLSLWFISLPNKIIFHTEQEYDSISSCYAPLYSEYKSSRICLFFYSLDNQKNHKHRMQNVKGVQQYLLCKSRADTVEKQVEYCTLTINGKQHGMQVFAHAK